MPAKGSEQGDPAAPGLQADIRAAPARVLVPGQSDIGLAGDIGHTPSGPTAEKNTDRWGYHGMKHAKISGPPVVCSLARSLSASTVASAGETDRDLAWTQLAQKSGVYNIIEF
jgi:hypothetical protein